MFVIHSNFQKKKNCYTISNIYKHVKKKNKKNLGREESLSQLCYITMYHCWIDDKNFHKEWLYIFKEWGSSSQSKITGVAEYTTRKGDVQIWYDYKLVSYI